MFFADLLTQFCFKSSWSNFSLSLFLPLFSCTLATFPLLLSHFLHALLDPAEELSGDGNVLFLFILLCVSTHSCWCVSVCERESERESC